jgi:hypothetical protein
MRTSQKPWVAQLLHCVRYELDGPGIESLPIPVVEPYKARVCDRSLAGIEGSNPARGMAVCVLSKDKMQVTQYRENSQRNDVFRIPWGSRTFLWNGYRVSFPGVKTPTQYSAEIKERVELYLYSVSGPPWPLSGRTLAFAFTFIPIRWQWNINSDMLIHVRVFVKNFALSMISKGNICHKVMTSFGLLIDMTWMWETKDR